MNKKFKKYQHEKDHLSFVIEEELVGFYLIVYKDNANNSGSGVFTQLCQGQLMAYHKTISLTKHQAIAFNINETELGLDDIEPEKDLF